jgi:hypothetical protein
LLLFRIYFVAVIGFVALIFTVVVNFIIAIIVIIIIAVVAVIMVIIIAAIIARTLIQLLSNYRREILILCRRIYLLSFSIFIALCLKLSILQI